MEYNWYVRRYQKEIIETGIKLLSNYNKFYLELATGGGKSFIIYNLIKKIRPDTAVIFSPRKKINKQNSENKYLSILDNDYIIYDCSGNRSFELFKKKCEKNKKKMLIVACPQSSNKKVYKIIRDYNLNNCFIWFDEAHHTIENWLNKKEERMIQFLLNDKKYIENRIFTSASPDKNLINLNTEIFGKLYSPIKVKDLISNKWLCPIKCKILEYDKKDFSLSQWIISQFLENKKSYGFSFHSRDENAYNLFYKHYRSYISQQTQVKPYLLIDTSRLDLEKKNNIRNFELEYSFNDIKDFEKNENSIAYVVKKYDMGYDFKKLDYIVISDPKSSFKDIIQCIGRGTRPDCKQEDGKNLNKELLLMLPTYLIDENKNDYKNIIEVLRYLVLDLEIKIEEQLINPIDNTEIDSKEIISKLYEGDGKNSSKLLDLLYSNKILNPINLNILIDFCKKYNIMNEKDYHIFRGNNQSLNLKSNLYQYPGFYWKKIVDSKSKIYYSSKDECLKAKRQITLKQQKNLDEKDYEIFLEDLKDNSWIELHKYDDKIPPYRDIDKFYPKTI